MNAQAAKHVVVPGTFDPVTLGHMDVIIRTCHLFPRVTVAVAASVAKNDIGTAFSLEERVDMLKEALLEADCAQVDVQPFSGLLVDFCHEVGAQGVVKGLRAMTDFEYELQQAGLNHQLSPQIESIFIMSNPNYGYISSSVVRELALLGGDTSCLVPPCIIKHLKKHFS